MSRFNQADVFSIVARLSKEQLYGYVQFLLTLKDIIRTVSFK